MKMNLYINGNMYDDVTLEAWQQVWDKVCKMCYEGTGICESIVTRPGIMHVNGRVIQDTRESTHTREYSRHNPVNSQFLTLDNIWKQYSHLYGTMDPKVVPEFKELVVPYSLYETLGVHSWFRHSFPNCVVTFWNE